MAFQFFNKSKTSFLISVGEEGAVVVYIKGRSIHSKFFVKSTQDHDVQRLSQLLADDINAKIYILIDTLDQAYVQKNIPSISALNVEGIAKSRMEREIPPEYLKSCVQVLRSDSGRKDWVYTFISAPYEPPLTKWISFFAPFPNIIEGLYFLPIQIQNILPFLRDGKRVVTNKLQILVNRYFPGVWTIKENIGWEIFFAQNKTGGFRQVTFLDGKIIFSRLINNINSPDADVLAGNIEQEISNSLEFITRLGLGKESDVSLYLVLSNDTLRAIRVDRIKAKKIKLFTPYIFARKINALEAATEKDKFCDPSVLLALSKIDEFIGRTHVKISEKVYLASKYVDISKRIIDAVIPLFLAFIIYNFYQAALDQLVVYDAKDRIVTLKAQIDEKNQQIAKLSTQVSGNQSLEAASEIVDAHNFFTAVDETPISIMLGLSEVMPSYARVKSINWRYLDPTFYTFQLPKNSKPSDIYKQREFIVETSMDVLFIDVGRSYEELSEKYEKFLHQVKEKFKGYKVELSDLPKNLNFSSLGNKLVFTLKITYGNSPTLEKGKDHVTQRN